MPETTTRPQCPRCATPLPQPPPGTCPACALAIGSDAGRRLLVVEADLASLRGERERLIARLIADERAAAGGPGRATAGAGSAAPPGGASPHAVDAPGGAGTTPSAAPGGVAATPAAALRRWLADTGPQALLAAAGVLLLAVAAVVFTAVTWDELPAIARGGILGLTSAGAAGVTAALVRRGLGRTAEATAVLAVVLAAVLANGLWRAGLLGGPQAVAAVTAGAAGLLAAYATGLARTTGTRAPRVLAAWLAPIAIVASGAWLGGRLPGAATVGPAQLVVVAALLAAAVVAVALARVTLAGVPRARTVTVVAGVATWGAATLATVVLLAVAVDDAAGAATVAGAVVLGGLEVAAALALRGAEPRAPRWDLVGAAGAWGAATAVGLAAQGAPGAPGAWHPVVSVLPLLAGVAALRWLPGRAARRAAAVGMLPAGVVAGARVADVVGYVTERLAVHVTRPWDVDPSALGGPPPVGALAAAVLAVVVLGALALATAGRRAAAVVGLAGGGLVGAGLGIAAWVPVGGAVVALAVVAAAAVAARHGWTGATVAPVVVAGTLLAVGLALHAPGATIAVLALAAAAAAPAARRDRVAAGVVAADLLALPAVVVAWTIDGSGWPAVALAVAAGVGLAVAAARRGDPATALPVELVAAGAGVVAVAAATTAGSVAPTAWTYAVGAVATAGVAAWRADRRVLRWVATALASATSATLLADAGVRVVEAYTVPPALLIIALSATALRVGHATSSWPGLGTGLGLLASPTLAQVVDDPTDLVRLVAVLAAGLGAAAAGRVLRLQAPVVIGVGVTAVAAMTQHEVVTDVVPRWALLAAGGALLLWLSVSYERQLLRLTAAQRRLTAMR